MHITCPNCLTKFEVDGQKFGPEPRKVKCSKCHNVWNYQPEIKVKETSFVKCETLEDDNIFYAGNPRIQEDEFIEKKSESNTRKIHLPMLIDAPIITNASMQAPIISGLIVILSVLLFSGSACEKYFFKSKCLQIESITMTSDDENNLLEVNYSVKNNSKYKIYLPPITTKLLDKEDKVVKVVKDLHKNLTIMPGQTAYVKTVFKPNPKNAYKVNIDLKSCFNIFG